MLEHFFENHRGVIAPVKYRLCITSTQSQNVTLDLLLMSDDYL